MSTKYTVGNLRITALSGWLDVTDEIGEDNPPFTLAKSDGVGALQFSIATYEGGKLPVITIENLRSLLADFALSRELGRGSDQKTREQPLLTCASSFTQGTQFLRVWYCSNGRDVVLVTYVCEKELHLAELPACEKMVEDLEFVS